MTTKPVMRVDAHAHVFERGLPFAPGRRYTPHDDAPLPAYIAHLDALGFTHGVLVQPSFLGTDNSYLLAALSRERVRLRGIAVVDPACDADEFARLAEGGIVGLRLNLIGAAMPGLTNGTWAGLLRRAAELRFQIEVQCEARRLPGFLSPLLDAGVIVVIDHFGLPDPGLGRDDPDWRALLDRAVHAPNLRLKLSAPYRLGPDGEALALQLAPALRAAFTPRRLVFGTDWPHTQHERADRGSAALTALESWLPNAADRVICLGLAAADLFRFENYSSAEVPG